MGEPGRDLAKDVASMGDGDDTPAEWSPSARGRVRQLEDAIRRHRGSRTPTDRSRADHELYAVLPEGHTDDHR